MSFCYSDLQMHNFMHTDSGQLYVIDFEHAAFLPISFMSYALFSSNTGLSYSIANRLPPKEGISRESENLQRMNGVLAIFTQYGSPVGKS